MIGAFLNRRFLASFIQIAFLASVLLIATSCSTAEQKEPIVFAELTWDSAAHQTRIASYIVENGYGYPAEQVVSTTVSQFPAFKSGSVDVSMEVWTTNAREAFAQGVEDGDIMAVSPTLQDNWQAWAVPQYVKDANPGLVSVHDIPKYKDLFATPDSNGKARFVTCPPGWQCEIINSTKIATYGLEDHVEILNPGTASGLYTDLLSAYENGRPWLGYATAPTKIVSQLDLYRLEEEPYTDECWETHQGCAYPVVDIQVVVAPSLQERAPEVVEFLSNWNMTGDEAVALEEWMSSNNETVEATAIWYLKNYQERWTSMVPPEVADKVNKALANES